MDDAKTIELWNKLLDQLEANDTQNNNQDGTYTQLEKLFKHVRPQVPLRFQDEIETCTTRTNELIPKLFDSIDCSNRESYAEFLSTVLSYGYLRLAQITYYNAPTVIDITDMNSIYLPLITKTSWYHLEPLLPNMGQIGWKGVLNSGLVRDEKLLMPVCLKLLVQKLHFYAIVMNLRQYQDQRIICKKNGQKVAEKLIEIITDVTFDDELYFIGMNSQLFNLLVPFIDENQLATFIKAIVEDLFKPFRLQTETDQLYTVQLSNLHKIVKECMIDNHEYQGILISSLIDHLQCNLIRKKRRLSIENENETITLKDLLTSINNFESRVLDCDGLMRDVRDVKLTAKNLQSLYLRYWVFIINDILQSATLTHTSSIKLFVTTSILLASVCEFVDIDLINDICQLATKIIDVTLKAKLDMLFYIFTPQHIVDLCQLLNEKAKLISHFDSPMQNVLRSYLGKYLLYTAMNKGYCDVKKLDPVITYICEGSIGKRPSRFLQYICIREMATFIEMIKGDLNKNTSQAIRNWTTLCSEKLYKFIKRHSPLTLPDNANTSQSEQDSSSEVDIKDSKGLYYNIATQSLVYILKISMRFGDQKLIAKYSEIIVRLFDDLCLRITQLVEVCKHGKNNPSLPLDNHLTKLLKLYVDHENSIKGYLNYDLISVLTKLFMIDQTQVGDDLGETKNMKKSSYEQIKTKLNSIQENAAQNSNIYMTIINQQYSSTNDDVIGSISDIRREKDCCFDYFDQMKIVNNIADILMDKCNPKMYRDVFENIVKSLEITDALDHPSVIYLFLMLRSLCSRYKINSKPPQGMIDYFSSMLPRISCCLIRISKSVELGPSIHAFTNPGSHLTNRSAQCCTYTNCIQIYSYIYQRCATNITNPLLTDAFEIIVSSNLHVYAKHSSILNRYFCQLAFATNKLLKSMSFGHKDDETLTSSIPTFISIMSNLIRCTILASGVTCLETETLVQVNGCSKDTISLTERDNLQDQLELLAIDIGRTLNNLSFLRVKLVEYAAHLISAYIKDCQRCACPVNVKTHLDVGLFRIFNLVDAHQKERQEEIIEKGVQRKTKAAKAKGSLFEMIYARLDQASREVFRDLHDNYNLFHRYQGKL